MAEGQNKNFDLKQKALAEFELKDVKELLNKVKESSFQVSENDLKKLDKDDNNLSETEKELLKKSKETLDMIKFLEGLIVELEKREKKKTKKKIKTKENQMNGSFTTPFKSDRMYVAKFGKLESNGIPSIGIESSNEKIKREENILKNILEKYSNNIDNLLITDTLEAKQDIKKILELHIINNSDCVAFNNTNYSKIKNKLLNKLNTDLIKKLNGYKFENGEKIDVNKIFYEGACKIDNLISKLTKLKGPNGKNLSTQEIQDIVFGIGKIKENKSLKTLKNIFKKYSLTLDNFKGKNLDIIISIFQEKNIPEEQQKTILGKLQNLSDTNKAIKINKKEIENIKNLLQETNNVYNKSYSNEYFLKKENKKYINKITDANRIIELFKYFKEKGGTFRDIEISLLNPKIQKNMDVLIKYSEIFNKKLSYIDIKNIDGNFLHTTNNILLENSETKNKLKILLDHIDNTTLYFLYLNNKKLYDFFDKNKKEIIKNLENKYNENNQINEIDTNNFNEIYNYISDEKDNIKIDNFLYKLIQKKEGINLLFKKENGNRILDLLFLDRLPKTANYIIQSNKMGEILENDPIYTYRILPIKYQKIYALKYTDLIIDAYKNKKIDTIYALQELKFPELKKSIKIFNKIKKYIPTLLKSSAFRNNFSQFQEELQQKGIDNEINKLNSKEKKDFIEFQKYFKKEFRNYNENLDSEFKKEYNTKIVKTIENNETIENNKKYIEKFQAEFWSSSDLNQLFSMFNEGITNKEETQAADITDIFHELLGKSLEHDKDISKELNQLRKLVDFKHYNKILSELEKRINKTTEILNKKSSNKINEFIKGNPNDKKFLDKLGLLIDNGEFGKKAIKKLELIYKKYVKKYYEKQLEEIKKNGGKINKEQIKENAIKELLGNANISDKLKKELLSIIRNTNVNEYIKQVNNTYNNEYAYSASDEEFNALSNQLENNYFSGIINDVKEYEKENGEIKLPTENQQNNESSNEININSFYSKGENNYTIKVNGEQITGLTQDEINDIGIKKDKDGNIIVENPDILENTINFYKFFKDLNLLGVWKYRKELTKSMGDININLEDDSLKKRELVKFGNKLIHFINNLPKNEKSKDIQLNENLDELSKIETELRKFSQANSMLSSGKTFNNLGEDILTANLRDLGIIGGVCFHTMQFRDIMNGKINHNQKKNEGNTTK